MITDAMQRDLTKDRWFHSEAAAAIIALIVLALLSPVRCWDCWRRWEPLLWAEPGRYANSYFTAEYMSLIIALRNYMRRSVFESGSVLYRRR